MHKPRGRRAGFNLMLMAAMGGLSLLLPMLTGGGGNPLSGIMGMFGGGGAKQEATPSPGPAPTTGGELLPELPEIRLSRTAPRAPASMPAPGPAAAPAAAPAGAPAAPQASASALALPKSSRYATGATQNAGPFVKIVAPAPAAPAAPPPAPAVASTDLPTAAAAAQREFKALQDALQRGNPAEVAARREAYAQAQLRMDAARDRAMGR